MDNLYILSNSPGEVSGWVKPVTEALAKKNSGAQVTLAVLPCPYASGMEKHYGSRLGGVDSAVTFRDLWKSRRAGGKHLILQLGGDPMYGAMLSAKLRARWTIYTARPRWKARVAHYFIPDAAAERRFTAAKVAPEKFTRVGNLALDSVPQGLGEAEAKSRLGLGPEAEAMAFLPGSRPFEYVLGVSFFCRAAEEVTRTFPRLNIFMPIAPTVDEGLLTWGLERNNLAWEGGERAETVICDGCRVKLVRGDAFSAIKAAKLAVAFPGTNNLQAAALGVPLMMVAPLNEAENIPLDGIAGVIPQSLPGFKYFKKKLVFHINSRENFVSLPNRLTQKAIVPEHRGLLTPHMVADRAKELLSSQERLEEIRKGYGEIDFEFGASEKITEYICRYFR